MSQEQIELLVGHMKEKLASPTSRGSRQPIDLASFGEMGLDKFLSQLSLQHAEVDQNPGSPWSNLKPNLPSQPQTVPSQPPNLPSQPPVIPTKQSKKRSMSGGHLGVGSVTSMPDLSDCRKSDTSSDDAGRPGTEKSRHKPRKSNLSGRQKSKTELNSTHNTSSKNLNVRFDPSQVPERSPYNGRHQESGGGRRHHRHHRSSSHHKNRSSSRTRTVEVSRTGSLPRSHSYSGRTGLQDAFNGLRDEDEMSDCSTCSSSSSDSDDPYAYQLPPRRAYGGVRISYVPNDRFAMSGHNRGQVTGRSSLRVPANPAAVDRQVARGSPSMAMAAGAGTPAGRAPSSARQRGMSVDKEKDKNCIIS